ncbi:ABC transporter ATP-binding protein [Desulfonatronum parangueonense]
MTTYKKILDLLTPKERRQGYMLLAMILVMAVLDTVGVASILPFMAVLGNPEVVQTNPWLSRVYQGLGYDDLESFLFFLGLVVFLALVLSISFKALTQYALLRFTNLRAHSLSCRLFRGYLRRPYVWFLGRHSADLGKSVLTEVSLVIKQVLVPMLQLIAHGTVAVFLTILLVAADPFLALVVAAVLGGAYLFTYVAIRGGMARIGQDRVNANRERFKAIQEALGGIKEVKIAGREESFFRRYVGPSHRFARHQANNQIAGQMPRYILEIMAFGGILLIALYLFRTHGSFNSILPLLALYAFAGYRLLPALQEVYKQSVNLRFGLPALDELHQDMRTVAGSEARKSPDFSEMTAPVKSIALEGGWFTYPDSQSPVVKDLSMIIPARSTVGLVGSTGSGKTTLVDIILGLLEPHKGRLLVDDTPITPGNVRDWQSHLGYVPQHIFLADDTVAANIAFGVLNEEVDMAAVIRAAKIAELHEFVSKELPKGYDTVVGERGVRLSGGQRQRIGIARALYHDPEVLVFDEATSALDNLTEKAVMQAVTKLSKQKTIIMIAHRLSTVEKCDQIFLLEHGQLMARGRYDELLDVSQEFRRMAAVNESKQE